jgi:hypothetical protein
MGPGEPGGAMYMIFGEWYSIFESRSERIPRCLLRGNIAIFKSDPIQSLNVCKERKMTLASEEAHQHRITRAWGACIRAHSRCAIRGLRYG